MMMTMVENIGRAWAIVCFSSPQKHLTITNRSKETVVLRLGISRHSRHFMLPGEYREFSVPKGILSVSLRVKRGRGCCSIYTTTA